MSCEENTKILESAYELAQENGISEEDILSWDLKDAFNYLMKEDYLQHKV